MSRQNDIQERRRRLQEIDREHAQGFLDMARRNMDSMSTMMDRQYDMLESFYDSSSKIRREYIKNDMSERQKIMEQQLEQMRKSYSVYKNFMSESDKRLFADMYRITQEGMNSISDEMTSRFSDMSDNIEDSMGDMSDSILDKIQKMAMSITTSLTAINVGDIGSKLEEEVDSYIDNKRQVASRTGRNFDWSGYQSAVSDVVSSGYFMSRSEASEVVSDLVKDESIRNMNYIKSYATELAAGMKTLGVSLDAYHDVLWTDIHMAGNDPTQRGRFLRNINNMAISLEDNADLNVNAQDILQDINGSIQDLYGVSVGDSKTTTSMSKTLTAIEAMRETNATEGSDALAEILSSTKDKNLYGLMEDDQIVQLSNIAGYSVSDFDEARKDPEKLQGFLEDLQDSLEDFDDVDIHNYGQLLGLSDSKMGAMVADARQGNIASNYGTALGSMDQGEKTGLSLMVQKAGETLGIVDKTKNAVSNNPIVSGFSDALNEFDIKWINAAAIVTATSGIASGMKSIIEMGGLKAALTTYIGYAGGILKDGLGLLGKGVGFLRGFPVIGNILSTLAPIGGKIVTLLGAILARVGSGGLFGSGGIFGGGGNRGGESGGRFGGVLKTLGRVAAILPAAIGTFEGATDLASKWYGDDASLGDRIVGGISGLFGGGAEGGLGNAAGQALTGASIGAVAGSIIPGLGTTVGGVIGGIIGGIGGLIGSESIANFLNPVQGTAIDQTGANSYANGLSNVPFDNFPAYLHKGEAVLTEDQANTLRNTTADGGIPFNSNGASLEDTNNILKAILGVNSDELTNSNTMTDSLDDVSSFFDPLSATNLGKTDTPAARMAGSVGGGSGAKKGSGGFLDTLKNLFGGAADKVKSFFGFGSKSSGGSGSSNSGVNVTPDTGDNAKTTWSFLTGNGFTPVATAAIMGNLAQESQLDPLATENKAYSGWNTLADVASGGAGIAQWTDPSRCQNFDDFMAKNDLDPHDLLSQLQFLLYEARTYYSGTISAVNDATDVDDATDIWQRGYEGAGNVQLATRQAYAESYYNEFAGNQYALGTPWVPEDQIALLHEGEAVVPADLNPFSGIGNLASFDSSNFENNPLNDTSGDTDDVIDTLKWMVNRLEMKLDAVISAVGGTRGRITPSYSDVDTTFSY